MSGVYRLSNDTNIRDLYKNEGLSEEQLKALGMGITKASGDDIPDAEVVEEKDK